MEIKTVLLDEKSVERALKRISHEIVENNKGVKDVVLLGIARGGIPVCEQLAKNIQEIEGVEIPVGTIDITLYRDDIFDKTLDPMVNGTDIKFSIKDKNVVLCDDVLFTGKIGRAHV